MCLSVLLNSCQSQSGAKAFPLFPQRKSPQCCSAQNSSCFFFFFFLVLYLCVFFGAGGGQLAGAASCFCGNPKDTDWLHKTMKDLKKKKKHLVRAFEDGRMRLAASAIRLQSEFQAREEEKTRRRHNEEFFRRRGHRDLDGPAGIFARLYQRRRHFSNTLPKFLTVFKVPPRRI